MSHEYRNETDNGIQYTTDLPADECDAFTINAKTWKTNTRTNMMLIISYQGKTILPRKAVLSKMLTVLSLTDRLAGCIAHYTSVSHAIIFTAFAITMLHSNCRQIDNTIGWLAFNGELYIINIKILCIKSWGKITEKKNITITVDLD